MHHNAHIHHLQLPHLQAHVAGVPEENTARKKELLKEIADASEELKFMGIQKDEVIAVIDKAWKI